MFALKEEMLYRRYQDGDFAALYAIEEVCFQPPLRFSRRYMLKLLRSAEGAAWIAEDERRMAGFAIVEWRRQSGAIVAYIPTIEVLPEQRGKGVGSELLLRLESSARAAGAVMLWLHVEATNSGAIRLYETHGFESVGRQENFYASGRSALVYRKLLNIPQDQPTHF